MLTILQVKIYLQALINIVILKEFPIFHINVWKILINSMLLELQNGLMGSKKEKQRNESWQVQVSGWFVRQVMIINGDVLFALLKRAVHLAHLQRKTKQYILS